MVSGLFVFFTVSMYYLYSEKTENKATLAQESSNSSKRIKRGLYLNSSLG